MGRFSFEDLEVWQRAVQFAESVIVSSEKWKTSGKHYRLLEQLESATTSVAMNIAEGKGRYSQKKFIQYRNYSGA
jgi:four helix bundle protein